MGIAAKVGRYAAAGLAALVALGSGADGARAAEPIKIGFSMPLTGGSANTGKVALAAMKIWEEDTNAKSGLLGRPVQLVYYDDQSMPSNVPAIYTKLLDVDKVDLVVGPYSTVLTAPAMPVVMAHDMVIVSFSTLNVNSRFHYSKYFAMTNTGPNPDPVFSHGFFAIAAQQSPKPQSVAIVASDQEFAKGAADGARENAKAAGFRVVYDKTYPPATVDFSPIVRAVQAADPDLFFIASYPQDSVGLVRAMSEIGYTPKMAGGAMVGLNIVTIKMQLGPLLNGIVGYENWLPAPKMMFPGVQDLLRKYQAVAQREGLDPLGYNTVPPAYAYVQALGEAVEATKSLDQNKIAQYLHSATLKTVWGDVKFGADGEWAEPRFLTVQYQNITGKTLDQFSDPRKIVILDPPQYSSGKVIYPYAEAPK
ncbi:MAG TPA: amino acid ABC transporter substrate-binding protein [Stellaceae bacterium]|nr:amino acid ABC transporter substrate-binding protein [Stellaceae bacterium]